MIDNLFFQNTSILAIQLSVVSGFLFWLFFRLNSNWRYLFICSGFLLVLVQAFLGGRAALLGSLASFLFCAYPFLVKKKKPTTLVLFYSIIVFFSVFFLSVLYKPMSSKGRLFIWEQSFSVFKENWITGVGLGGFNRSYNHQQAHYFSTSSLYTENAMYADNGYFAFNEWLHVAVEFGITGFLFFGAATGFLLLRAMRQINSQNGWQGAILLPILAGSLFSYPLHNFFILVVFLLLSCIISYHYIRVNHFVSHLLYKALLTTLFTAIVFAGFAGLKFKKKYSEMKMLEKVGNKTEAYYIGKKLTKSGVKSYRFTTAYLNLMFETGRITEAIQWFEQFHPYHCSEKVHQIAAKCYEEKGDFSKAEANYIIALYIKPHLLQSRINLMRFYKDRDGQRARYWASEVIKYPVKIKNIRASHLKSEASRFLSDCVMY